MPKKQKIDSRLEKLFKSFQSEETPARSRQKPEFHREDVSPGESTELLKNARQPDTRHGLDSKSRSTKRHTASLASLPVILPKSSIGESSLAMAFQTGVQDWSTLQIFDESEPHAWSEDEQLLVKQVTEQLSLALENARLFQEAQRRAQETSALAEVGREVSSTLDQEIILNKIVEYAKELLKGDTCAVYLPDADENAWRAIAAVGADTQAVKNDPVHSGEGILGKIILQKNGAIINNASELPDALTIQRTHERKSEHIMGVPILTLDRVTGLISIWRAGQGREFTPSDLEFFTSLSRQAAIAIQNARLYQETQRRSEEFAALNRIVTSASQTLELDKLLEVLLQQVLDVLGMNCGLISLYNDSLQALVLVTHKNLPVPMLTKLQAKGLQGSLCEYVFNVARAVSLDDLSKETPIDVSGLIANGLNSYLGVPLETKGRILGTLCLFHDTPGLVNDRTTSLAQSVGIQIGFAIDNARLFQQVSAGQAQLAEALRVAKLADWEYDVLNDTFTFNDALYNLLHTTAEQEGGYTMSSARYAERFVHPEDAPIVGSEIQKALETTDPDYTRELDHRIFYADGGLGYVTVRFRIEKDSQGRTVKTYGANQDITERMQAEEAIRRQNEYLAASSEIGRLITSTLDLNILFSRTVNLIRERFGFYHAAIFIVEETGFNAVLKEATGHAGEEMKKQEHAIAVDSKSIVGSVTSKGNVVVVNNTARDSLHQPNPLLPDTRAELGIPLRVGDRIIGALDIQSTMVDAFSGNEIAVLQTLADQIAVAIDNARSYELSQQAVMEMREIDRFKSQFLANMSHELRTPLNSIIGFSRVIIKGIDGPITELQQQDLTAIYNSGQHLLGLINDILDLSKIEAGKMELAFDEVNMADLTNSVLSTMTGLIKDKSIILKHEIQADLPPVRADAIRIRQVMINLLSNAAKFTEEGEIKVEVSVKPGSARKSELLVSVTDTGPGINTEDQEKLFLPFSQVDDSPTRKTGGTGLGLSISRHLIQMHGGQIGVHSAPGKGSTFYFSLPLHTISERDTPGNNGKIILAIDDDPQVIGLYERYLKQQGYEVIGLSDPARAVEKVKQINPYAVTLDIMMPGIDGWQVLGSLKSNPDTRETPVIVCSIIEDQEKGFSLGAADYLVKPILEEDLVNALDRLNSDGAIREVLVIDDDPNDLRLIGKMLTEDGRYKPLLAEGGRKGWEIISSGYSPHAVILDLFMPEMDGFKILENMRADKKYIDIPIIVISGLELTSDERKQLNEFGQKLLTKGSLNNDELFASIGRALHHARAYK